MLRPEIKAQQKTMVGMGGGLEVQEYEGPPGQVLAVVFIWASNEVDDSSAVEGFERGAHESMAKLGADKAYTRTEDANTMIVDEVVAGANGDVYLKRMAGATGSELHGLSATCVAPEAVCGPALRSLTLDHRRFVPLHSKPRTKAYLLGRQVGRLLVPVALLLLVLWLIRRRKKRAAA